MPVIVGIDSYVTEDEADDYFAAHFGYGEWESLPDDTKSQLLRSGTVKLDAACDWYGEKCEEDQLLAHPREDNCPDVSQGIKDAQCELSYLVLLAGASIDQDEDILTRLKAGSVELEFKGKTASNAFWSDSVAHILSDFGLCNRGSTTKIIPVERG